MKEESLTSHIDTPKRYESTSNFYDSNSETLHGIVEINNIGKKGKGSLLFEIWFHKNSSKESEYGFESIWRKIKITKKRILF